MWRIVVISLKSSLTKLKQVSTIVLTLMKQELPQVAWSGSIKNAQVIPYRLKRILGFVTNGSTNEDVTKCQCKLLNSTGLCSDPVLTL